jgi:hypothetical protein
MSWIQRMLQFSTHTARLNRHSRCETICAADRDAVLVSQSVADRWERETDEPVHQR